jgi:fucose 4-O-acetylase-like acetyltransferase
MKLLLLFLTIYSVAMWYTFVLFCILVPQMNKSNWKEQLTNILTGIGIFLLIGWVFFFIQCYKFCSKIIIKETI